METIIILSLVASVYAFVLERFLEYRHKEKMAQLGMVEGVVGKDNDGDIIGWIRKDSMYKQQ